MLSSSAEVCHVIQASKGNNEVETGVPCMYQHSGETRRRNRDYFLSKLPSSIGIDCHDCSTLFNFLPVRLQHDH